MLVEYAPVAVLTGLEAEATTIPTGFLTVIVTLDEAIGVGDTEPLMGMVASPR